MVPGIAHVDSSMSFKLKPLTIKPNGPFHLHFVSLLFINQMKWQYSRMSRGLGDHGFDPSLVMAVNFPGRTRKESPGVKTGRHPCSRISSFTFYYYFKSLEYTFSPIRDFPLKFQRAFSTNMELINKRVLTVIIFFPIIHNKCLSLKCKFSVLENLYLFCRMTSTLEGSLTILCALRLFSFSDWQLSTCLPTSPRGLYIMYIIYIHTNVDTVYISVCQQKVVVICHSIIIVGCDWGMLSWQVCWLLYRRKDNPWHSDSIADRYVSCCREKCDGLSSLSIWKLRTNIMPLNAKDALYFLISYNP
jgi:hypothetical protein